MVELGQDQWLVKSHRVIQKQLNPQLGSERTITLTISLAKAPLLHHIQPLNKHVRKPQKSARYKNDVVIKKTDLSFRFPLRFFGFFSSVNDKLIRGFGIYLVYGFGW